MDNFTTVLAFALLLVFVMLFSQIPNNVVSSGTVLLDYNFIKDNPLFFLAELISMIAFLFFYSVFIVLIVFAVRRDLSKVKIHYYLAEKIQKFAVKLFMFLLFFSLAAVISAAFLINFGIPIEVINLTLLIIALLLLFLPQSIVIDETSLPSSIKGNIEFMGKNVRGTLLVLGTGAILIALLPLLEYVFDLFFLYGSYVSLLITLLFIIPYLEVLKSQMYMHKFDLVKHSHKEIKPKASTAEASSLGRV